MLCLVGLDYFSTLAYLPSIAVEAAGPLAPLRGFVVLVTFCWRCRSTVRRRPFAARPRRDRAGRTYCPGWRGKILVLTLLGFAAADFVITRSLSVADAASALDPQSARPGPAAPSTGPAAIGCSSRLSDRRWPARDCAWVTPQMVITLLLSILTFVFWWQLRAGITRRMLIVAAIVVLALSGPDRPGRLQRPGIYRRAIRRSGKTGSRSVAAVAELVAGQSRLVGDRRQAGWAWRCGAFRRSALGLSGFELIMTVVPRVRGLAATGEPTQAPRAQHAQADVRRRRGDGRLSAVGRVRDHAAACRPAALRRPAAMPSIGRWPISPTAAL